MQISAFWQSVLDPSMPDLKLTSLAPEMLCRGRVSQTPFIDLLHALSRQKIVTKVSDESQHVATSASFRTMFDRLKSRTNVISFCFRSSSEIDA